MGFYDRHLKGLKTIPKKKPASNPDAPGYYFPVATRNYKVSQVFGNPSSRYKSGYHRGVDIAVPIGTPVVSVAGGYVVFVGKAGEYGNRVAVRGDDGNLYTYNHLSGFSIETGRRVDGGVLLGYSGNTGNSTGPHLHFQVDSKQGQAIDPSFALGSSSRFSSYQPQKGGDSRVALNTEAYRSSLANALRGQKFPLPFDISSYLDKVARSGLSGPDADAYLYSLVTNSPEFDRFYPGIKRPDGTFIMSPPEYEEYQTNAQSAAAATGVQLTRQQIGASIFKGVSLDEFQLRAKAVQRVKANPETFQALQAQVADLNAQRAKLGLGALPQIRNLADATNFVMGEADKTFYDTYEAAAIAADAKLSGLQLTNADARGIAQATPGALSPEDQAARFKAIASIAREAGPELYQFGITNSDLVSLELGGGNALRLAGAVEQALRQAQAAKQAAPASPYARINDQGQPTINVSAEADL